MILIKDFMLQLFFALLPFALFNIYYRDRTRNYSRNFIIATCVVCLFLSMTFAFSVENGVVFDIRYIIMYFGVIYGGIGTGLILLAECVLYRLYIGGWGLNAALVILLFTFPLTILFYRIYKRTNRLALVTVGAGVAFSIIPFTILYLFNKQYVLDHLLFNVVVMPIQNLLGVWLLVMLFRKTVEDKNLYIRYIEQERVQTIGHVAASLAHEVRNPLTTVKGFLQLLREYLPYDEKVKKYTEISFAEMDRTEAILSEYLAISRPNIRRSERVDMSQLLAVTTEMMAPFANLHQVELDVRIPEKQIYTIGSANELKQVLVNIVKNAIEACVDKKDGKVTIEMEVQGNALAIFVNDNGIGMDEQQLRRLGTVYFTTKSSGTGLGLTYSFQVIRSLGGAVKAESKPQQGTRFIITLPLA